MKNILFIQLVYLIIVSSLSAAGEIDRSFKSGTWLKTLADGTLIEITEEDLKLTGVDNLIIVGGPVFKEWAIIYDEKLDNYELIGKIVSSNTGFIVQGAKVFLQYGDAEPFLFAISDINGNIKMRLNMVLRESPLDFIFVGDLENRLGTGTRIYNAKDKLLTL